MKAIPIALSGILLLSAAAQAQSLADVAREERARQANETTTIILTNDSVPAPPPPEVSSEEAVKAPAAGTAAAKETEKKPATTPAAVPGGRDEVGWGNAFREARTNVKRAEDRVTVLESQLSDLNRTMLTRSDIYNKEERVGADITAKQTELANARAEVVQTHEKLAELEEEFRRSGAPAGWGR